MSIVCFHNPDEENGYLSNWYLSEFECDGSKIFIHGTVHDAIKKQFVLVIQK